MGRVLVLGDKFIFTCCILSAQIMDRELEKNLYILVSLFLFFLEREIVVDIMFLLMSLCF